jgi:hypothetical protein
MTPDWKKVGRNSKNKGRAYERRIADELGWQRVPFSGASRDWGEGDVIDCYYSKKGLWRGECKKQPARKSGDIVIDQKWLEQIAAVKDKSRMDVIFTQEHGSPITFVVLPPDAYQYFIIYAGPQLEIPKARLVHAVPQGNKGTGFKMSRRDLDRHANEFATIWFKDGAWGGVMRLPLFKHLLNHYGLDCQEEE